MNLEGAQWLSGRVLDSLDPDQDQHSDLGPNCLQRLPADNKSCCKTMKLKLLNELGPLKDMVARGRGLFPLCTGTYIRSFLL